MKTIDIETNTAASKEDLLRIRLSDKQSILAEIETLALGPLWDYFLKNQVQLYFDQEKEYFSQEDWWRQAQSVLEIGSGNGEYLSRMSRTFTNKKYLGMEKTKELVQTTNMRFQKDENITFIEGDAQVFNESLVESYDVIIFRFLLQHLQNPMAAIDHAHRYLKPQGSILIIDICDSFRKTSHPIPYFDAIIRILNERNKQFSLGNRLISSQILRSLKNDQAPLAQQFDLCFSNIDECGNPHINQPIQYLTQKERTLHFNHLLHIYEILKKGPWQIPVDLSRAYDELRIFLDSEQAWVRSGEHVLVLRKK
jgi:ubiquinone/menaquinone biosynthesis C-methylase UbiE